jgi:pteridine reductase
VISNIALKRHGDPLDIARAIVFLIRDATYTTGQIIPVDGGRMLSQ